VSILLFTAFFTFGKTLSMKKLFYLLSICTLLLISCKKKEELTTNNPYIKAGVVTNSSNSVYTVFDTIHPSQSNKYDITGDGVPDFAIIFNWGVSPGGQDWGKCYLIPLGDVEILSFQKIDTLITYHKWGMLVIENYNYSNTYPADARFSSIDTNTFVKKVNKYFKMSFSGAFTAQKTLVFSYDYLHYSGQMNSIYLGNHWNQFNKYAILRINTKDKQMIAWVRLREYEFKFRVFDSFVYYYNYKQNFTN